MANKKSELVAAALEDGLGTEEELNDLTKTQILDLWSEGQ